MKGDLSGVAAAGSLTPKLAERLKAIHVDPPDWRTNPAVFWDVFGRRGFPIRATISDLGPLLLGRLFGLNATQQGVLALVFKVADDNGLLLLDLKDLRAMLQYVGDNAQQFQTNYGNVSAASIGAIQRGLLALEQQGAEKFIGEPMLNIDDLLQTGGGKGVVNVLAADKLMNSPKLYSTMLLWLLSELYERLPEIGDPAKPKLVFFFDEAHRAVAAREAVAGQIERVVRLIHQEGIGVYFAPNPLDVPETVLGQRQSRPACVARFQPRGDEGRGGTMRAIQDRHRKGDSRARLSARPVSFSTRKAPRHRRPRLRPAPASASVPNERRAPPSSRRRLSRCLRRCRPRIRVRG